MHAMCVCPYHVRVQIPSHHVSIGLLTMPQHGRERGSRKPRERARAAGRERLRMHRLRLQTPSETECKRLGGHCRRNQRLPCSPG